MSENTSTDIVTAHANTDCKSVCVNIDKVRQHTHTDTTTTDSNIDIVSERINTDTESGKYRIGYFIFC